VKAGAFCRMVGTLVLALGVGWGYKSYSLLARFSESWLLVGRKLAVSKACFSLIIMLSYCCLPLTVFG
jgi:hypothetical protein